MEVRLAMYAEAAGRMVELGMVGMVEKGGGSKARWWRW